MDNRNAVCLLDNYKSFLMHTFGLKIKIENILKVIIIFNYTTKEILTFHCRIVDEKSIKNNLVY